VTLGRHGAPSHNNTWADRRSKCDKPISGVIDIKQALDAAETEAIIRRGLHRYRLNQR
jgi:hypothetical protein